jgi:hypothetical protein
MKKLLFLLFIFVCCSSSIKAAQHPDTVSAGVYINSIHDVDFKDKQYTISLWLWLKYRNYDFDFSKYLEVPMAKTVDKSFYTVDTLPDGRIYMLMKLQCVMKDSWKIQNFPFDRQKLKFSIENSQYDSDALVFVKDTLGKHYSKWVSSDWDVIEDSFKIITGVNKYQTNFGDPTLAKPRSEFSTFKVQLGLERDSWWLFLKLFIGMYISFLLSFLCFFIHSDSIDSRFSLTVGSLFAVIGNKYVVDSMLPESTSFTLVDSLHGITLCFVFAVVACSVYTLKLAKRDKIDELKHFDKMAAWVILMAYLILNVCFVYKAYYIQ